MKKLFAKLRARTKRKEHYAEELKKSNQIIIDLSFKIKKLESDKRKLRKIIKNLTQT